MEYMGYYKVAIDQTKLIEQNLPMIICRKTETGNNWEPDAEVVKQELVIASIEIEQLKKYNAEVEFISNERCLEFTERVENYDIFGWMMDLMAEKNIQSVYEMSNDPLFSSSKLTLAKTSMNSMSGKYKQHCYENVISQIKKDEFHSNLSRTRDMVPDSEIPIGVVNRNNYVIRYKKQLDKIKGIKPIYVGDWIYRKSRSYIYDNIVSKLGMDKCLYHDTDSVKFKKSDYGIIKQHLETTLIPHNQLALQCDLRYFDHPMYREGSKIFGGFANELKGNNNCNFVNDKKEWASFVLDNNKVIDCKFSLKGVPKLAIVLDINDKEVKRFISTKKSGYMVTNQMLALKYDIENRELMRLNKPINTYNAFNNLINDKTLVIMNSQFV
jgi:hypothetical protein